VQSRVREGSRGRGVRYQQSVVGRTCGKGRFRAWSAKLWTMEVTVMNMSECKGD